MADETGKLISSEAISELIDKIKTNDNEILNLAKEYSDGLASNYATAVQGTKANSALQPDDITTGDNNGAIKVKGTNISVKGLGSAAYTNSSAYDAFGAADTAETNAKEYADGLANTTKAYAKNYADSLASQYDAAGAANAVQKASEPKKITGVVKIDFTDVQPSNDIYTVNNINQRFANLVDAQSGSVDGERLVETSQNFSEKTIIVSPASDADWILWQEYGIRCSGQSNITENEDSLTGGLSFSSSDKPDVPTYANIIILY